MSGDVQPRKRKDRRRKRDLNDSKLDGETAFSRKQSVQDDDESSHGVHITKMGNEDVHLHVHHEHGTGGHWCAKVFFFSLLVVLAGLVGLILLENRGLSDLDTPLSESRFSNYFDGWVEETRDDHGHDEHDSVQASIEDHDEHDEPFEEEEDQSQDDNDHDDDDDDHDDDEDDHEHEQGDEDADDEDDDKNDDEDQTEEENASLNEVGDDDDDNDDGDEDDDDDDNNQTAEDDTQEGQTIEEEDDGDENDDNDNTLTQETNEEDNDDDDDDNDNGNDDDDQLSQNDDDDGDDAEDDNVTQEQTIEDSQPQDDDDDPFDEDDDDGTFESLEKVVENDAEELLLLQEKARQQAGDKSTDNDTGDEDDDGDAEAAPSWASSLAVKIGVGVALALVARHMLIRKNPNTKYSEEEIEIEEEIEEEIIEEYIDSDDNAEHNVDVNNVRVDTEYSRPDIYTPDTFEQLNAMYRSNNIQAAPPKIEDTKEPPPIPTTSTVNSMRASPLDTTPIVPSVSTTIGEGRKDYEEPKVSAEEPDGAYARNYVDEYDYDVDAVGDYMMYNGDDGVEISDEDEDDLDDLDIDDDDDDEDNEGVDDDEDLLDDISDVDDSDLMNRLEAKYGRLPPKEFESDEDAEDPSWIQIKVKDTVGGGPQSMMDDEFNSLERELRDANAEMLREASLNAFDELARKYPDQPQVFLAKAQALDKLSDQKHSNKLLGQAIDEYKRYLAFGEIIENHTEYRQIAEHCIDRMRFIGYFMQTIAIHEKLIQRFPKEPHLRNQLAVSLLMMNRLPQAKLVLEETLKLWPSDGFALVHYGFVLKQHDSDYENAIIYLREGIRTKAPGTQDGRFFFNLGEALQRLGRHIEARDVFEHASELQLFPSLYQRSLYNEPNLRGQPFWSVEETTYGEIFNLLEANWLAIRDEGLALLNGNSLFLDESENLRDTGDWKQFELFTSGQQRVRNCQRAPLTCGLIKQFRAAAGCRRGQVKFSVMRPGTHVWPHCGPTNCRLRAHLGLVVPPGPYLRVAETVTSWTEGKFLIFDDSFEHEVWHNGTGLRLVLIVDVWHPDLSEKQRQTLSSI